MMHGRPDGQPKDMSLPRPVAGGVGE